MTSTHLLFNPSLSPLIGRAALLAACGGGSDSLGAAPRPSPPLERAS